MSTSNRFCRPEFFRQLVRAAQTPSRSSPPDGGRLRGARFRSCAARQASRPRSPVLGRDRARQVSADDARIELEGSRPHEYDTALEQAALGKGDEDAPCVKVWCRNTGPL